MWIIKFSIKHDCVFGNRCERFKVHTANISFGPYEKENHVFIKTIGTLYGKQEHIDKYMDSFNNDPKVVHFEREKNSYFVLEKRPKKETPGSNYLQEMMYVKPVLVDENGLETWEFAAMRKDTLMDYFNSLKEHGLKDIKLLTLKETKITDIFFPRMFPHMTENQRDALELASKEGYYAYPRRIRLEDLSRISGISLSTFREHLRKAESKVLGSFF